MSGITPCLHISPFALVLLKEEGEAMALIRHRRQPCLVRDASLCPFLLQFAKQLPGIAPLSDALG